MTTPEPIEQGLVSMPRSARQEVIPADPEYPLIEGSAGEMLELADDNLRHINILNLHKIRATKDGYFQVETAEGAKLEKTLLGMIEAFRIARVYWGRVYNPGQSKEPPSCTSPDGFTGVGEPGGPCGRCPFAQFKSARNPDGTPSAGQACKELRQLLVLLPGQMMPHLLSVQPTSLANFDKYSMSLNYLSGGAAYWNVVTKFGIEIVPASGYPVPRITFQLAKRSTPEQRQLAKPYHLRMRDLIQPMVVEGDAYEMPETGAAPHNQITEDDPRNPDDVPF